MLLSFGLLILLIEHTKPEHAFTWKSKLVVPLQIWICFRPIDPASNSSLNHLFTHHFFHIGFVFIFWGSTLKVILLDLWNVNILFWTGDEANKAKRQFKIIKHILKAFMLRRTKALLIESGILALPPLTELTVYGSLFQEDIFPFLCALALSIFLICYKWFLQDGAADTVTKEALHVSVAERAANTYFIY